MADTAFHHQPQVRNLKRAHVQTDSRIVPTKPGKETSRQTQTQWLTPHLFNLYTKNSLQGRTREIIASKDKKKEQIIIVAIENPAAQDNEEDP